jgi:hypothetical protein
LKPGNKHSYTIRIHPQDNKHGDSMNLKLR